jgi:hypothetical protein
MAENNPLGRCVVGADRVLPQKVEDRRGPNRIRGRRGAGGLAVALFCASFLTFEVLHPVSDLLHGERHRAVAAGDFASASMQAEDLPTAEAHGPYVASDILDAPPRAANAGLAVPSKPIRPDVPSYEPPPPIPIRGRRHA